MDKHGRREEGLPGLWKRIVFTLGGTIFALALVLVCLEIALRIAGWTRSFEIYERVEIGTVRPLEVRSLHANATVHHVTKEFDVTYRTNSWGYYDREWDRIKKPGTLRIAFFGDSFTMGHGVGSERAFPRLVEELLQKRWNRPVETLNFGIWGSGTLDEKEYIADALKFDPDYVVVCFYINDVFDNVRYMDEKKRGAAFKPNEEMAIERASGHQRMLVGLKEFLNAHSRAFAFVTERTKNLRDALGLVTYPLEGVFTGKCDDLLKETAGYLNVIADDLAARAIPMTVVYLPAKVQISTKHAPKNFDLELPNRLLAANLKGLVMIDLTGDFRGVNSEELWFREGHYNERGHEFVAAWLAEKIPVPEKKSVTRQ